MNSHQTRHRICVTGRRHDWRPSWGKSRICAACGDIEDDRSRACPTWRECLGDRLLPAVADVPPHGSATDHWRPPSCDWCVEAALRRIALAEQEPVRRRLKAEEQEVLALYNDSKTSRMRFWDGTPSYWKERYPSWLRQRQTRLETAAQRRALRRGRRTLAVLRDHLRAPGASPLEESAQERTSRTS